MRLCKPVSSLLLMAVVAMSVSNSIADEPSDSTSREKLKFIAAMNELREATKQWNKSLGPDGTLDQQTLEEINSQLKALSPHLQQLMQDRRSKKAAAERPAPSSLTAQRLRQAAEGLTERMRSIGPDSVQCRAEALEEIRADLKSDDSTRQQVALMALTAVTEVDYDKESLRSLILEIVEKEKGDKLLVALLALHATAPRPEDIDIVYRAYDSDESDIREGVTRLLFLFGNKEIEGKSAEIVLECLADPPGPVQRETLRSLWGAKVNDAVAARLIELAKEPTTRHDAIYFGLSTLQDKSEPVIDVLTEALTDSDWNNRWRALWGLGFGIPDKYQEKVASILVKLHNARTDPKVRADCERLVKEYGNAELIAKLN